MNALFPPTVDGPAHNRINWSLRGGGRAAAGTSKWGIPISVAPMTEAERSRISAFVEREFGIKMPPGKKSLLEGRLGKRVAACGLESFGSYFDYVTKGKGRTDEYFHFMDLVSTHETAFFREPRHFEYLRASALPILCDQEGRRSISVLCAACSTGEEAYTLAMIIDSTLMELRRSDIDFTVEGFDLSSKTIDVAAEGIFPAGRAATIPEGLRRRYLMMSKDRSKGVCRFVPELRVKLRFHTGNLLGDPGLDKGSYDILFCRNVLIYFDHANQRRVVASLVRHMNPNSFLFLGHSETLLNPDLPLRSVAHSVYREG